MGASAPRVGKKCPKCVGPVVCVGSPGVTNMGIKYLNAATGEVTRERRRSRVS